MRADPSNAHPSLSPSRWPKRFLLALLVLLLPVLAEAATVRGKLVRSGPQGDYPAQGIGVTLLSPNPSVGRSGKVYSGSQGVYVFYDVSPGNYTLEIWTTADKPQTQSVAVTDPSTDLPPVRIP